jgi:flagellar FliL protein
MATAAKPAEEGEKAPSKSGIKAMLLPLILMVAGGGGAFFATYSGLIDGLLGGGDPEAAAVEEKAKSVAFVPIEPFTVSLGGSASARHLRFAAQLEVSPDDIGPVTEMKPRIIDALNTYLRAVDEAELEDPRAMIRLRAQMLRRIEVVLGSEAVNDLLIIEFVLN